MSDLQCPARFLVLADPDGAAAGSLRHERVAAVYGAPPHADGLTALAGALGVPLRAVERRLTVAEVVAESAGALDVLRDLADLHRGETVVVGAEGPVGQRADVSVDGDGVTVIPVSPGAGT